MILLFFGTIIVVDAAVIKQVKQSQSVFIQNKGQWSNEVLFLARIKGMNAWVTKQGIRYDFHKVVLDSKDKPTTALSVDSPKERIYGNVVDMECIGAKATTDSPNGLQKSYYNYILGRDKSKWAGYASVFNEIIRHDVYKGIDERLYFDGNYMRYDFIVAPGGNPNDIALRFNGAKGVNINNQGELVLQTSIGEVVQQKLYAYQTINNIKKQVECTFIKRQDGSIGFQLADYDNNNQLVIDPLLYSTFIGGADVDVGNKVVLDIAGNAVVVGTTQSSNFPTQVGSYDRTIDAERDVFVAKFSSDLNELIFCTYYGGTRDDFAKSCAVDEAGYVVFCGFTFSDNLPYSNVEFDHIYHGSSDGFIAKLSYSGADLIYGAYLGGAGEDAANDVVLVPFVNDAVVVGFTKSSNFPIVNGALRPTNNLQISPLVSKTKDGFVTKVNVSGSGLVFSTFLGLDSTIDECNGVALDRNNYPIVVGKTRNDGFSLGPTPPVTAKISFKTTATAFRKTNSNIQTEDGFLVKLGINGGTLDYSTLIGANGNDECFSVDVDRQGIAAVCGITNSADFNPTVFDQTFGGGSEGFVMKLGTNGGMYFSTFLGGSNDVDEPKTIKYYDITGSVVIAGTTLSTDFPTGKVIDFNYHGGKEGFVIQLNPAGNVCLYSAFVGGSTDDEVNSIAVSNTGNVYITGSTLSQDLQTTSGAKFKEISGWRDCFVMALNTCSVNIEPPHDTLVCPGKPLTLTNNASGTGTVKYDWKDIVKGTTISTNPTVTVTPDVPNVYTLTVTDDNCSKTISYIVSTKPLPNLATAEERKTCVGTELQLSAIADPTSTIAWYDAIDATTPIATGTLYTTPALKNSIVLYVESQDTTTKCTSGRKQIRVNVVEPPSVPTADHPSLCVNSSVKLSAIFPSDVNFRWYDSLNGGKLLQVGRDFTTPTLTTTTVYYLESLDTTTNCISAKRFPVTVTILPSPNPSIQGQNSACLNSTGLVYEVAPNPNREYKWTITLNGQITSGLGTNKITVSWIALGPGTVSLTERDLGSNCTKDVTYLVNVSDQLSFNLGVTGSENLCTGDSVVLDAGAGYSSYKWSSGETSQSIIVKTGGNYSVAVEAVGGCKGNSNIVAVTLNTRPTPKITGQNVTCVNGVPVQYSVTPVAVNSYNWTVSPEGTIVSGQGSSTISINWTTAGSGSVKVTESSSLCTSENTMGVTISSSLSPTITAVGKTALCEGESVELDAGPFASYKWSSGETSRTITVTKAGSYTVEVTDASGCKGTSQPKVITVSPLPVPSIVIQGKLEFCEGDSVILNAGLFNDYLWSNGATSQKITVKTAGKYSVTVTNQNGCKGISGELTTIVNPLPVIPTISQKGDDSLVVSPYIGTNSYKWYLNGNDIGQINESVYAANEGNYTVEVTNANGCTNNSLLFSYLKPNSAVMSVSVSPTIIEAIAGETVRIPLVITSSKNLTQAIASNFTAQLSVEPTILVPISGTSTIDNTNRRIISVNGIRNNSNDTLAIIEMKAALGAVESSSIIVKSLIFESGKVLVSTKDGVFNLSGICKDGGVRLYKPGSILSLSLQPNPASEAINMTIATSEEGQYRILLTNPLGEDIAELYNGRLTGTQEIVSALNDIPSGVYFVVLQSPSEILVKRILIAK